MATSELTVEKGILFSCLNWFQTEYRQHVVSTVETHFPDYTLPVELRDVLEGWQRIRQLVKEAPDRINIGEFFSNQLGGPGGTAPLFKQMLLWYRRHRADHTEAFRDKTFHPGMIETLETEIRSLDAVVSTRWFQQIASVRLPRSNDFLPIQFIEQSAIAQIELAPRQYDEKFHILQTPSLFLQDLAYFRIKCEVRDVPITVAFLDIDGFKAFNTTYGETKVDRNLLPRFMQLLEAHLYHHGFAYRQGGDEYLVLIPGLSRDLALDFLEELRSRLAASNYAGIDGAPTVSIGVCIAEPESPLTDRELRDRANQAKTFAKEKGKNCIATFDGPRLVEEELRVVRPVAR